MLIYKIFSCINLFFIFFFKVNVANETVSISVPAAGTITSSKVDENLFVQTEYQNRLLADILQSYAVGDFCLVGRVVETIYS